MARLKWYLSAVAGAISVWWAAPLVKLANVDAYTAAVWRFLTATIAYMALSLSTRSSKRNNIHVEAFIAGILLAAHITLWFESLNMIPTLPSTAFVCTYPLFTLVYEVVVGEESPAKLLAVPLLLHATFTALEDSRGEALGIILSLTSASMASAYFLILRRARRKGADNTCLMLYTNLSAFTVIAFIAVVSRGPECFAPPATSIPYLAALGLVPSVLGHGLLSYALRGLTASTVTMMVLSEPLGASLLSYVLLGETPSLTQTLYSLEALAASVLATVTPSSRRH